MNSNLPRLFKEHYGHGPTCVSRAPGRLEILGNHTDYNEGFVLSAAVSQATEFAVAPVQQGSPCRLKDFRDGSEVEFSLDSISEPIPGDWSNYVRGIMLGFSSAGVELSPFNAAILSSVPLSAGMSSSAALEISAGFALRKIFNADIPDEELARMGQAVENSYLGLQSGLLDQFSSIYGREDEFILCDFRSVRVIRTVPIPGNFALVVANSLVKHDLVDSDYNLRRESCEKAVSALKKRFPRIRTLRDVDSAILEKGAETLDRLDYMRAKHVVGENERVMKGVEALDKGDVESFGELLYKSHESSRLYFENSCPELDCLVELSSSIPGCAGARLSGGGFGGISIHLVERNLAEKYRERLTTAYKLATGKEIQTLICSAGPGAKLLDPHIS